MITPDRHALNDLALKDVLDIADPDVRAITPFAVLDGDGNDIGGGVYLIDRNERVAERFVEVDGQPQLTEDKTDLVRETVDASGWTCWKDGICFWSVP